VRATEAFDIKDEDPLTHTQGIFVRTRRKKRRTRS